MQPDKLKTPTQSNRFVRDGAKRLADSVRAQIKEEVEVEFSERMAEAGWLARLTVRREIRSEIERRIAKQMPSEETLW
jgi:uncharacterized sporulation protein YeaH/YhbH (DUF444 family)